MSDFREALGRIGLSQYLQCFTDEGFDTWDTLMDITESDLQTLGVKLGHRRKLQRAVVQARKHTKDEIRLDDGSLKADAAPSAQQLPSPHPTTDNYSRPSAKRKYRRHPKADENAPERPPSAYVIFSNQMRDELRNSGRELSFTEIAKLVGERWQSLATYDKEPCEHDAQQLKEKYYSQLAEYKKTSDYAAYQDYLADFRLKHGPHQSGATEAKRPKLDRDATASPRSSSPDQADSVTLSRDDLHSSKYRTDQRSPLTSPASTTRSFREHRMRDNDLNAPKHPALSLKPHSNVASQGYIPAPSSMLEPESSSHSAQSSAIQSYTRSDPFPASDRLFGSDRRSTLNSDSMPPLTHDSSYFSTTSRRSDSGKRSPGSRSWTQQQYVLPLSESKNQLDRVMPPPNSSSRESSGPSSESSIRQLLTPLRPRNQSSTPSNRQILPPPPGLQSSSSSSSSSQHLPPRPMPLPSRRTDSSSLLDPVPKTESPGGYGLDSQQQRYLPPIATHPSTTQSSSPRPWLSNMRDSEQQTSRAKTSLATLLQASEELDRKDHVQVDRSSGIACMKRSES